MENSSKINFADRRPTQESFMMTFIEVDRLLHYRGGLEP